MDGPLLNPRGPLPPGVYWRRRLALIAVVLLVFVVGVYSCSRGDEAPAAKPVGATTSVSPTPTAAATVRPTTTPTTSASPTPAKSRKPDPSAPCPDKSLTVEATADARRYAKGTRPVLTLSVTNTGRFACTRDLGQRARELRLTSGRDRVWSSDDCSPGGAADRVVLKAGEKRSFSVTWSRRRSKPECPAGQKIAAPGTYRLAGRLGDIEVPGTAFILT
jgi:hypothetical protein